MQKAFRNTTVCLAFTAIAAFAQTKPAFEVATIKLSPPLDVAAIRARMQAGGKMPIGPKVDSSRAEYTFMDLQSLIALAYGMRADQIKGPDWLEQTPFDIVAKLPAGATKNDAPLMLQSLLEDRLGLAVHRATAEHAVLALVVAKSGLKMKPSAGTPATADNTGIDIGGGMRVSANAATGASVFDMGLKGRMSLTMKPATGAMHMDLTMMTMGGLADWLTEQSTNNDGPQVIDMTGIEGNYDASMDVEISPPDGGADPGGGGAAKLSREVQALGLKLEPRKAMVEMLIIDHVEKTPTGN